MLAVDFDEGLLRFPYYASPKVDGIRCLIIDGEARTRSMKRIPNFHVREWFQKNAELLAGLDGELVVGDPAAKDVFGQTSSGIMAHGGVPAFTFLVFDVVDTTGRRPFTERWAEVQEREAAWPKGGVVMTLPQVAIEHIRDLHKIEDVLVDKGFEGVMLRHPAGRYKQGRATLLENSLLKVKRFRDAEAVVVGVEEQMHNTNPGIRNEIGRTKRSSARAGLVGKDTLGALVVKGSRGQPFAGVRFSIGTGFDDAMRTALWAERDNLAGLTVKYRFLDVGTKDAPRHPVFTGFRPEGS
jgi:DNA ligase-1